MAAGGGSAAEIAAGVLGGANPMSSIPSVSSGPAISGSEGYSEQNSPFIVGGSAVDTAAPMGAWTALVKVAPWLLLAAGGVLWLVLRK